MVLKERVPPSADRLMYQSVPDFQHPVDPPGYQSVMYERNPPQFYQDQYFLGRGTPYQTLPTKKTQIFLQDVLPERSVTPDITRGLERNERFHQVENPRLRSFQSDNRYIGKSFSDDSLLDQQLGIPVAMPHLHNLSYVKASCNPVHPNDGTPNQRCSSQYRQDRDEVDTSFKISPIDPRNTAGFQSSTPSQQIHPSRAIMNLDSKLLSPKKSTMSNEELYAVIHKSKKKMNIKTEDENRSSPVFNENQAQIEKVKTPETGYLGDKIRTRLSWSPNSQEQELAKDIGGSNDSRSRLSWACNDRKKTPQTSRLDFKKLLLQKSGNLLSNTRKPSAVEQLKLSKQQIQQRPFSPPMQHSTMNILELSGSPRSLVTRRFQNPPGSPKNTADKVKPPKLMSPRSQWRFASPRSDVLSSTILEDCREDEMNSSGEKKPSPSRLKSEYDENLPESLSTNKMEQRQRYVPIAQRFQAQRTEFYKSGFSSNKNEEGQSPNKSPIPALETSF